ncbi:probable aquaporin SIP2-1 [Euphorbia lathyris]|uniref:probable aquaporin SIP2-1 n=1 Tax=Euphorbia lathyris TaxID=212925 RepID=UPI0033141B14
MHDSTITFPLIISDFIISFMWVWSDVVKKILLHHVLGFGHDPLSELIKCALSVLNLFFFAFLSNITKGASYNPLTILASAISGDFSCFLLTVGARIPAQVLGSVTGVRLIIENFPGIASGPHLSVDIHRGALTEGLLAFAIAIIYLTLARKIPGSFFRKNWIASISKLALQILASDLTGACMNPAAVMGWAYARGEHITKEHILVYWVAPVQATVVAVWTFKLLVRPKKEEKKDKKND